MLVSVLASAAAGRDTGVWEVDDRVKGRLDQYLSGTQGKMLSNPGYKQEFGD